jgi:uncharacterized membrane protein (DUF106 family)
MSIPSAVLQKQLATALKRIEEYKRANEELKRKMDSSEVEKLFDKLRHMLVEKEHEIEKLASENHSLKEIARFNIYIYLYLFVLFMLKICTYIYNSSNSWYIIWFKCNTCFIHLNKIIIYIDTK